MITLKQILVATDFGEPSDAALAYGRELASRFGATLRRRLHALVIDSDRSSAPTVPIVLTAMSPAPAILDYAKNHDIDAIVMGTHGRGAFAHLVMGSVAERVVRLAPCPVLTVRHPEHEFVRPDTLAAVVKA